MNKTAGTQVLLTSDDIQRWQADLQEQEAIKAKTDAKIAELHQKLDAAALIVGAPVLGSPTLVEQESMRAAVERILSGFDRFVEHHELQAELRKTPRFVEMLDKHKGAYYYTLIKRLRDDGKIRKFGRKIRLVHKNETPPEGNPEGAS